VFRFSVKLTVCVGLVPCFNKHEENFAQKRLMAEIMSFLASFAQKVTILLHFTTEFATLLLTSSACEIYLEIFFIDVLNIANLKTGVFH
jgi:hypothetical protein